MKNNKGFSLIELVVVIAIMGIMVGFLFMGFGVLTGTDAKECANNLDSVLDKAKTFAMSKSGGVDAYMELSQKSDGAYYASFYLPNKPIASAADASWTCTETQKIGKKNVSIECDFEGDFEGENKVTISEEKSVKFYFDRISGAFKEAKVGDTPAGFCSKITVSGGRTYELNLVPATGKHSLTRIN